MTWTNEWPIESGMYWFYGWTSSNSVGLSEPRLRLVEVRKVGSCLFYVTAGNFMCANSGSVGKWSQVVKPELPDLKEGM